MRPIPLGCDEHSLAKLRDFYQGVYTEEFPVADERESLENMEKYLRLKAEGWYGKNNYHILLLENESGAIAGGIVADYFDRSNVGVIEFVVVDDSLRGQGLGRVLIEAISDRFREDCERVGYSSLNGICGEVNDPYRKCDVPDHLDGFARMRMWHRFGFRLLDFPYIQPALGEGQSAVLGLGLMFRPEKTELSRKVPAELVEHIVADYQIWAMRIPEPDAEPDFQRMQGWLKKRSQVELLDMGAYVCGEESPPFEVLEIKEGDVELMEEFARVYTAAFADEETAVDVSEFAEATRAGQDPLSHHYWLWGVKAASGGPLLGLASFFSFPHCGFGGYAGLSGPIQHKGCIKRFLRLIEQQMVRVNDVACGWYGECDPGSRASRLAPRLGFTKVPMIYRQPRLHSDKTGVSEGKELDLFYKPFGRVYEVPVLALEDLKRELCEVLARIYFLDESAVTNTMAKMTWPVGDPNNVFSKR